MNLPVCMYVFIKVSVDRCSRPHDGRWDPGWSGAERGGFRAILEIILRSASVSAKRDSAVMCGLGQIHWFILTRPHLSTRCASDPLEVRLNLNCNCGLEKMLIAGWRLQTKERTWVGFKWEGISCVKNGLHCRFHPPLIKSCILFCQITTTRLWIV